MNKRELSVRDEAIAASKETPEEFRARIPLAAAVKLYEVGRVSSDVAARIAGISRSAFLTKLGDHRVDSVIDTRVSWSRLWLSRVPRKVWSGGNRCWRPPRALSRSDSASRGTVQ